MNRGSGLRRALSQEIEGLEYVMKSIANSKTMDEKDKKAILDKLQDEFIDDTMEYEDITRSGLYSLDDLYNSES